MRILFFQIWEARFGKPHPPGNVQRHLKAMSGTIGFAAEQSETLERIFEVYMALPDDWLAERAYVLDFLPTKQGAIVAALNGIQAPVRKPKARSAGAGAGAGLIEADVTYCPRRGECPCFALWRSRIEVIDDSDLTAGVILCEGCGLPVKWDGKEWNEVENCTMNGKRPWEVFDEFPFVKAEREMKRGR